MDQVDRQAHSWNPPATLLTNGKDEMNLAEFPIAALRSRGDTRDAIIHEGHIVDKEGNRHHQRWSVSGDSVAGLPTEFDERVYVALMAITADQNFHSRRVPFSIYSVIKILGLQDGKRSYEFVEHSLDRLKGATIKAKGAFWDHAQGELVHTAMAFNLIDKYWLSYREKDERIREVEGVPAYIVWGEDIWKSFRSGYIKELDLGYFYSLGNPTARRLFRFLDKRMHYQNTYEIDIFELASRLGMIRYPYASHVRRKLEPAIKELTTTGFLLETTFPDRQGYIRARFVRAPRIEAPQPDPKPTPGADATVVDRLVSHGLSRARAEELVGAHPQDYLEAKIEFLEWKLSSVRQHGRPITDPPGWLVRAIKEDYQPPESFRPQRERQQKAAELERAFERIEERSEQLHRAIGSQRDQALARLREEHGTGEQEERIWAQAQEQLRSQTVPNTFRAWLAPLRLLSISEGLATLAAPNHVTKNWVEQRISNLVCEVLGGLIQEPVRLAFEVISTDDIDITKGN